MSHGKQSSLGTRQFTSVNVYVTIVACDWRCSVCIHRDVFVLTLLFLGYTSQSYTDTRWCTHVVSSLDDNRVVDKKQVSPTAVWMKTGRAASAPVSFSLPAILFVQQLRPPVNAAARLASSPALLLLISARHRDRQKERAFSGRS